LAEQTHAAAAAAVVASTRDDLAALAEQLHCCVTERNAARKTCVSIRGELQRLVHQQKRRFVDDERLSRENARLKAEVARKSQSLADALTEMQVRSATVARVTQFRLFLLLFCRQ
jgi:hypothetical protein